MTRELIHIEKDIYNTESIYLQTSAANGGKQPCINQIGNIFKGWDASNQSGRLLTSQCSLSSQRRMQKNMIGEKFFSLSSVTAPRNDDELKRKQRTLIDPI